MKTGRSLRELLSVPGFVASAKLRGIFGDPKARIVQLRRRKKRPFAQIAGSAAGGVTTSGGAVCGIFGLVIPHIFDHMDIPRTMSSSRRIPFQITSFPGGLSFFLAR